MHYPDMTGQAVIWREEIAPTGHAWAANTPAEVRSHHYGYDILTIETREPLTGEIHEHDVAASAVRVVGPWRTEQHVVGEAIVANLVTGEIPLIFDPEIPEDRETARALVDMLNDLHLAEVSR